MSNETPTPEAVGQPIPFAPRSESEKRTFERTREEVEQMNADFETAERRARIAKRLGGAGSSDCKPE